MGLTVAVEDGDGKVVGEGAEGGQITVSDGEIGVVVGGEERRMDGWVNEEGNGDIDTIQP